MKATKELDIRKKRMKPARFWKKYSRLIFGGIIVAVVLFFAIFAEVICKYDPLELNLAEAKQTANAVHILGTDYYGRDLFSRLCHGAQTTLIVALGAQLVSSVIGAVLGLLCGYYSKVEKYLMRILDAFSTIPNMLLCLMMVSIFGSGVINLILAMSVGSIPGCARMVRNQVLSLREKEYIESEKAMGASDLRTIFVHILPGCMSYLLVRFSSGIAGSVLSMTSLSYLGLGLDPAIPSWGGMINEAQQFFLVYPHMTFTPAIATCVAIFGFSLLGDAIRDLLDPKLR